MPKKPTDDAPKLTQEQIEDQVIDCAFHVFEGTTLTVCCLTVRNGYTVTGESACISPENFDKKMGEKIARENATAKIWALEGYRLKQQLTDAAA